jgi:dipeptidyl aminopeptidase/acylaminoacyl peptidase
MQPIRASDYHDLAKVSDPRLSPDGEWVAFIRTIPKSDTEYEATIYTVPVDGTSDPKRFTASEGADAEPRWSPDGKRLAFASTRGEREQPQLYVMPANGGEARQVTRVVGGVSGIGWSPDGDRVAFTQSVTPAERREGLDLAADAEYEREPPDPRVIDRLVYRTGTRYFDGRRSGVYAVDLATDIVERVSVPDEPGDDATAGTAGVTDTTEAPGTAEATAMTETAAADPSREFDYVSPAWGDADTLYYAAKRTGDPDDSTVFDVIAHDLAADETETITQTSGWEVSLAATENGRVAFPYTPEERATLRATDVRVYNRETDETHILTAGLDRTAAPPLRWGPEDEELYFLVPDEGRVTLRAAAVGDDRTENGAASERDRETNGSVRTVAAEGEISGFDVGNEVVLARSEWHHPGDLFAIETDGTNEIDADDATDTADGAENAARRLTEVNADMLAERAIAEPEEIRFESANGVEIQGWALYPPEAVTDPDGVPGNDPDADTDGGSADEGDRTYPLIVEIHGGPHAMWSTSGSMFHEFQTLAARGYAVFWSNPRGSVGYGEGFQAAIEGEWGTVTARDVLAGADELCERASIDETNQFVTGGSFGGYMTAWLVGHTDRFRGAVSQRGVYDLASFYGSTDAFKLVEWDFDATPWDDPTSLWERSPVAYAGEVATPTLLIHADLDYRVPVNNAEMLYLLLRRNGVETRLVRYPREGHELSRSGEPAHVVDRLSRIVRWFDGYSAHHDVPKATERGDEGLPVNDAGTGTGTGTDTDATDPD